MRTDCLTEMSVDIETYSSRDIKLGAYAYCGAPDFDILLVGYKLLRDEEPRVIDCLAQDANGNKRITVAHDPMWEEWMRFMQNLLDPRVLKCAYNANFERTCLAKYLGVPMPPEQWRCTQVLAVQCGLPRSLKDAGAALGLDEDQQKLKTGEALIRYFSKPCKPTKANGGRTRNFPWHSPEKWEMFVDYNKRDVVAEAEIRRRLLAFAPDPEEQELWNLDQEINDRGVLLDLNMARTIIDASDRRAEELFAESSRITGLSNPNSLTQLKAWLKDRGIPADQLRKEDVTNLLADEDTPADVRRVLEIRASTGKSSVKKYQAMLDIAGADGRARGIMQFYGGHTGRWAGRGLQPQNLVRNSLPDEELDAARELVKMGEIEGLEMVFGDPAEIFSQLVRTAFIPSPGCRFVVTDFSAIEARVIAWIAGEEWRIQAFAEGQDIYCESASRIYHVPVVKHGENGELRQRGKVAELACAYGGGVGAMRSMDTTGSVPEEELAGIVRQWRTESPNIVRMWKLCEQAAARVMAEGGSIRLRRLQGIEFYKKYIRSVPVLFIRLPGGRPIAYWDMRVDEGEMGPRLSYMAQDQKTREWIRMETYGGRLTENIVQAVARDCLAEKMRMAAGQRYKIAFHVHDELILDVPRDDERAAEKIDRIMSEPIEWARGLPLKGGTYECDYYRKD